MTQPVDRPCALLRQGPQTVLSPAMERVPILFQVFVYRDTVLVPSVGLERALPGGLRDGVSYRGTCGRVLPAEISVLDYFSDFVVVHVDSHPVLDEQQCTG